ncbi:hypothetical protein TURU_111978 [Turdus rufiventris]|nr:hypothetical protein TURU_111978 [Turdus rufiventris]
MFDLSEKSSISTFINDHGTDMSWHGMRFDFRTICHPACQAMGRHQPAQALASIPCHRREKEELGTPGASKSMECDREKVWSNSPGVKEEDMLPYAEIFSRDAAEEEKDLVTLPNHTLLLRLSVTPRNDVRVDPVGRDKYQVCSTGEERDEGKPGGPQKEGKHGAATSEIVWLSAKATALANLHHHQQNNCITVLILSGNMMTFADNCYNNSVIK